MPEFRKKPVVIVAEQFHDARRGQDTLEWIRSFPKGVCFKAAGIRNVLISTQCIKDR